MVILLIFRYYFDLTIDITISVFCLSNMTNYWPTIYLVLWYTQIKWIGNNIDHPNYSVPFAECFSPAVDHIWNRLKDMKSIRNVMAKSFSGWKAPIQSFDSQGSAGILLLKLLASELPKLLVNFISSVLHRSCWIWGAKMSPGTGGTATFSPTGATSLAKVACTVAGHSEISNFERFKCFKRPLHLGSNILGGYASIPKPS